MTNLTEQWKKGELPSGWYWVELKEGTFADGKKSIILNYLFEFTNDFERHPYLVESVLGEVPSYEEWQEYKNANDSMFDTIKMLNKDNGKLEAENTKLKELLKECYFINEMVIHTFNWLETIVTPSQKHICPKVVGGINKTQQRINQVLGEEIMADITWKEFKQWAKSIGAKVKHPLFGMERVEFKDDKVHYVVYKNGCSGCWREYVDFDGEVVRYFSDAGYKETFKKIKKNIEGLNK